MNISFSILGAISLSAFWATAAQATFSCEVLALPEGSIALHKTAGVTSPVILMVPKGALVSDMSGDKGILGVWVKVTYATDPQAQWGEGDIGWVG